MRGIRFVDGLHQLLVGFVAGSLFIARAAGARAIAETPLFIFFLEQGRRSGSRRAREGGRGRGWPARGGWWGERPPARSPAAGVVEDGGGP